jgi:hypothetical protein
MREFQTLMDLLGDWRARINILLEIPFVPQYEESFADVVAVMAQGNDPRTIYNARRAKAVDELSTQRLRARDFSDEPQ